MLSCTKGPRLAFVHEPCGTKKCCPVVHLRQGLSIGMGSSFSAAAASVDAPVREAPSLSSSASSSSPSQAAREAAFSTDRPPQQREAFEVDVQGQIPKWLKGSLVRNGPGFFAPEMQHLFDGYAMLVKFTFDEGKVTTMQRLVESVAYTEYLRTGKMQFAEFGTQVPLTKSLWNTVRGALGWGQGFTDNASVNTYPLPDGKGLVAMTEAILGTYKVDIEGLNTQKRVDYRDSIKGNLTSAHPPLDPDGTMYNVIVDLGKSRCVVRIDPVTQTRTLLADVPMDVPTAPSWVHDLPATANYIIVPDTPVLYDIKGLVVGGSDYVVFKWAPEQQKTKFHIVPKDGGTVKTVVAPFNYMSFHYANAFESADGKTIYLDCPTMEDPDMVNSLLLDNLRNLDRPVCKAPFSRITIPLDGSSQPTLRTLVPVEQYHMAELCRINPNYKFKDYQYAYAVSAKLPASYGNALSKFDFIDGSSKQWHESGCIPTEPQMLPRPGATAEDDGVVTSVVTGSDGKAFLLVLDAASFEEIARAKLPYGIPYSFHSQFYPN